MLYRSIALRDTGETVGYIGVYEEEDNLEFYVFREYRHRHYCAEEVGAFVEGVSLRCADRNAARPRYSGNAFGRTGPAAEMLKKAGFMSDAVGFKLSEEQGKQYHGNMEVEI